MIYKTFYSEVGKLLYALAKANGSVSEEEVAEIHRTVVNDLVPLENSTDEYGTDSAYYVEMEFDYLNENDADPDDAFMSFIDYVEDHFTGFDPKLRQAILDVTEKLSAVFKHTEIQDKGLLTKIRQKLSRVPA